ncbi:MAG: GNAT family N-acetyltransferase [Clostridia bacterium]|nr:GNAT family N-acetyltransferase [Clostridia bacterium]
MKIRKYEEKDFDGVRFACLNSEGGGASEEMQKFVLCTFCDYYIEKEPENCFVLDDNGKAVGYVICAENYDRYKKIFDEEYLPKTKQYGEKKYHWAETSTLLHEKHKQTYPAHLHIDLLPEYQRKGFGGKLIHTLFDHLRSKNIPGVMLTTGKTNETACNFYKKYGFELVEISGDDAAFGMKLD